MKRYGSAAIFVMMLAASGPAVAQGPRGGGPGGRGGRYPGVIRQLVFPCEAACRETAKDCGESAEATAFDCVSAACSNEITAAQDACASDRTTDPCRTAISALRDCGSGCTDTERTAQTACRSALGDCVDACATE